MERQNVDLSEYLEIAEFVRRSGYARSSVYRWIDEGLIESKLVFNARLIPLSELERIQTHGSPKRQRSK